MADWGHGYFASVVFGKVYPHKPECVLEAFACLVKQKVGCPLLLCVALCFGL